MANFGLNFNTTNILGLMQMAGGSSNYGTISNVASIFSLLGSCGSTSSNITRSMGGSLLAGIVLNYAPQILGKFIGGITSAVQASRTETPLQDTKEDPVPSNSDTVADILSKRGVTASTATIQKIAEKYPDMKAIQVGNLSVEDRIVNLARGLESQKQFGLISESASNEEMIAIKETLLECGINSEEDINNLVKTGAITQETADIYIQALNFEPTETPEPIILDAVNKALQAGDQKQFNNAYLQYAREQIETYDTNNDGVVQFEEFEKVEKENAGELYDELSTKAIFNTINQNGNDEIDAAEMASLIWATSKINDTETSKSAGDITASEVKTIMDAFTTIGLQANLETLNKNATDEEKELYKEEIIKGLPNASLLKKALKNGYTGFSAE